MQNPNLQTSIVGGQFKPDIETNLVCILNNVENPTQIRIRLLFGGEELDLKLVNAQVRSDKNI